MTQGNSDSGMWVNKNWLIGVLVMLVAFLGGFIVQDKVAQISKNSEEIASIKVSIETIKGDMKSTRQGVEDIKKALGVEKEQP